MTELDNEEPLSFRVENLDNDLINGSLKEKKAKYYKISSLMKNTDFKAQRCDPELQEWNNMKPVGKEVIQSSEFFLAQKNDCQ